MKLGITLPTFEETPGAALEVARAADGALIDGVFAFDHLWPIGQKSRPALSMFPMLGAVAARTSRIAIGSLVARIGLLPSELVAESLRTVHEVSGGRLIAALGIGDASSASENEAFAIPYEPVEERRALLLAVVGELTNRGVECWIGATAAPTIEVARAAQVTVNLWDVSPDRLKSEADVGPTTWAGPLPREAGPAAARLAELREAGATWAVWGWPRSIELVLEARRLAGI